MSQLTRIVDLNRCLIVTDLDGTLLTNEGEISKYSEKVIKQIVAQGHIFCIATGRPLRAAKPYYDQLGLKSIMINYNGSYISNPSDPSHIPLNLGFSRDLAYHVFKNEKINK